MTNTKTNVTTLEVTRLHDQDRAARLTSLLKLNRGYMIDDVVMAPYMGGWHISVVSSHVDAPEELSGFVMMVLASLAAR